MVGITSVGIYVPTYRLSRDEIAKAWGTRSLGGEKAVANCDEDSVTMAVAAVLDCLSGNQERIDGLSFATTTAPYKEKQGAAIVAAAVDLVRESRTADCTNSLRAATTAMNAAIDSVSSGSARNVVVTASDCRIGAPKGDFEMELGDGAAAVIIGSSDVIASVEGTYSVFDEFTGVWRSDEDTFVRSAEQRFVNTEGYVRTVQEAVSGLMEKYKLTPKEFSKAVFYAPDAKSHANLARSLGFDPKTQVQDTLFNTIGNTGAAAPMIMLAGALEKASPGDRILLASYGDGSDVFIFNVTENIDKIQCRPSLKECLARKKYINYVKYASWRGLIEIEASRRPSPPTPAAPCLWRERESILTLYGVKCRNCGTVQYPPARVCTTCQAKDNFEKYKFSDKRGQIFTYSIDYLAVTSDPPGINAVIDFDGGGRMQCELTDCTPEDIGIGIPVEMTFRQLYQSGGIHNYFWKARPIK